MKKILIVLIVFLAIFAAILLFAPEEPERFPGSVVFADLNKNVSYYAYNKEKDAYSKKEEEEDKGSHIFKLNDEYFFWSTDSNTIFSRDSVVDFREEVEAVDTYKEYAYVCVESSLVVLNDELEEIDRVDIEVGEWAKNAHDIFIHDDTAYLLDNIMFPIYILTVDVKDPANLKIIEKTHIEGVNQHLVDQWLDRKHDQWVVLQSQSTTAGGFLSAYFFDAQKVEKIGSQRLYSNPYYEEEIDGFNIVSSTDVSPVWAIIVDDDHFVAKIGHKKGDLFIEEKIFLAEDCSSALIKEERGYLFVACDRNFLVFEDEEVIVEQTLKEKVSDFIVY